MDELIALVGRIEEETAVAYETAEEIAAAYEGLLYDIRMELIDHIRANS